MKIFIHIGAPKAASSSIQHFFHSNKKINFLGLIRDHENINFNTLYENDFFSFCRHKIDNYEKAKIIRKKLSKTKINVLSDEDFFTSSFANFEEKLERINSIFPTCEFLIVLRDPIETILSWHSFRIRGNKNLTTNIREYISNKDQIWIKDIINYQKRIEHFKKLKNKFHIFDFKSIKNNKLFDEFNKLFEADFNYKIEKKNQNIYFITLIYSNFRIIRKIKFLIPSFIIKILRKLLLKFSFFVKNKSKYQNSDLEYLNKTYANEIKYYKLLFKENSYFTLN